MKKIIAISFVVVSLFLAGTAGAVENGYLLARMWERQEKGIQGVLECFKNNCPPAEYQEYLIQIVSAETNLIVYGVSPKDTRLVSPLASDVKTVTDFPAFAYKVFKKRMEGVTSFSPEPGKSFEQGIFKIHSKDNDSGKMTIDFEFGGK